MTDSIGVGIDPVDPLVEIPSFENSTRFIYAYELDLTEKKGQIKVGETTRTVRERVLEQVATVGLIDKTKILMTKPAFCKNNLPMTDTDIHKILKEMPGVRHWTEGGGQEWFKCSIEEVLSAFNSVYEGKGFERVRDKSFVLRQEQENAIEMASTYFDDCSASGSEPRFLWNAKMRFGKTFASYHLARRRNAKRILVVTYKPAVEDSWQIDLETHKDFDGWHFISRSSNQDHTEVGKDVPLVCFSSLQDLRGRDSDGAIRTHNEWIHATDWDLIIVDEYHYGAWNSATRELLSGEDGGGKAEIEDVFGNGEAQDFERDLAEELGNISGKIILCLSGTPFRAIASREFGPDQIYNWTYTDEQRAKLDFNTSHPDKWNPYASLPSMRILVYKLPDDLGTVAKKGERDEFDLNEFFRADGRGKKAVFVHQDQVQGWLEWIRGQDIDASLRVEGTSKPFPFSDKNVLPYMNHSVWFLPSVSAVFAMRNLLDQPNNKMGWSQFTVLPVAGKSAGIGAKALPPVREAIGTGYGTKTITLTCGKLLTGVTVPQWSSILILNNLKAPETYFQAAFRVQSSWSIWNPEGNDPNTEEVIKPACLVLDFAPNRSLRLFADYAVRLGEGVDADEDVRDLSRFLPVLGFDGTGMRTIEFDEIIDTAFASTSIDARKMDSRAFINPDTSMLDFVGESVRQALSKIGKAHKSQVQPDETVTEINKTPEIGDASETGSNGQSSSLTEAEGEGEGWTTDELAERLRTLCTRINIFMYLSDPVEKNLSEVLTTTEKDLFHSVMGIDADAMNTLVKAGLFNEQAMRLAIHQFRRSDEDSQAIYGDT